MADAVLNQRLVVGAGALALLFLCVCGVLVLLAGCALIATAVDRWRTANRQVDDILAATPDVSSPPPAAPDNVESVRLDWADQCDRILAATNNQTTAFDAGCDRLLAAIHDDQHKEEL